MSYIILTVRRFALSRYPFFEPAKMQSMERIKAMREKRSGISAEGRMMKKVSVQQSDNNEKGRR